MPEDMDNLDLPDRSSVKDTYEQVLSDLKKAEELMSDFKSPAYASKYAAQALLAKVYMYMSVLLRIRIRNTLNYLIIMRMR